MSTWKKWLIGTATLLTFGAGASMVGVASGGIDRGGVGSGVGGVVGGGLVDISGPCDEAEHANDPRCTGAGVVDDNSGPGNGDAGQEDNSGPSENSGPGSGNEQDEDNSGPGHGDDDHDYDNSGPGSGDD